MSGRSRWLLLLLGLLVAGGVAGVLAARQPATTEVAPAPTPAVAVTVPAPPPALARLPAPPSPAPTPGPAQAPAPAAPVPIVDQGYPVNLERLRAETPRNRYWIDSVPTRDPEVLKRRETEAAAWNQLHGKVLSGTATTDEIQTWLDHRRQVSEDAIEFAQRMLDEHGSELPERDRGLLELAIDMHRTRLAELPREESDARARKDEQDRRRAAWNGSTTPP